MNPNTSSTDRQTAASADIQTASSSPAAETQTASSHVPDARTAPPKKRRMLSSAFSEYFESLRDGRNLFLLWAFLIPAGLLLLFYISRAVFPIGEGSVLILDLNGQYVSFFEELRNKLLGGGSLLYSWSRTLGGEFLGIFAYYLASPFSLIVCLFPARFITEALLLMFMLKAGACGFTMALYLRSAHPGRKVVTVAFSTLYALSSYAVVQAHNTMWIDELIFLPLLVLGIERLIKEKKFLLYTVSLAYCAMSNFYIGYMVCIFTFLYFFYYYFAKSGNGENNLTGERLHLLRSLGRMLLFSAIGLLVAAAVICPAYVSLAFGKNEFSTPDYTLTSKFDLFDLFARLFPASYDTVRRSSVGGFFVLAAASLRSSALLRYYRLFIFFCILTPAAAGTRLFICHSTSPLYPIGVYALYTHRGYMSIGKAEIFNYFSACILMTIGTAAFFFARCFFTEKRMRRKTDAFSIFSLFNLIFPR